MMNQLADDIDTSALPDAGAVRREGDRLRLRSRRRVAIAAAAAAIVTAAAGMTITRHDTRSEPEPVGRIDGWRVTRTLDVPGNGIAVYAGDSLWVVDNKDLETKPNGTPKGVLYQLDPESGKVLDRLPGVIGGWPSVGG